MLYSADCDSIGKVFIIVTDEKAFLSAAPEDDVFVNYEDGCDEKLAIVSKCELNNIVKCE